MQFSSFDEGVVFDFDCSGVKARLRAAMFDRNLTMESFEKRTGLTLAHLEQAFEGIERGDPEAIRTFSFAAVGLGVSPNWLISDSGPSPLSAAGRIVRLAWEYVYRKELPLEIGKRFVHWLRRRFDGDFRGETATINLYRRGVPPGIEAVDHLYKEFSRDIRS